MTFASTYTSLVYLLVCCGPAQTDASLRFSPDRSQFFKYESVFLSCEDRQSNSTGWRVKRLSIENKTSECDGGRYWGKMNTTGCLVKSLQRSFDSGLYWCESSGGKTNTVNMTVIDGGEVILAMSVLPVMEGSDVTLHCWCWKKIKIASKSSSDLPADFYKDGSLIRTESTGQMTIHNVNKSDEGFYKCHISDLGESPESWMDVRGDTSVYGIINHSDDDYKIIPASDSPATKDNGQPDHLSPYFYPLMLAGVSIFLLILHLCLCLWKKCRACTSYTVQTDHTVSDPCNDGPVQSQGTNQLSPTDQRTNQSGAPDDVYCPLQQGSTSVSGIWHANDYENDPWSVGPVQPQGTNQGSPADQGTNQSGTPDDVYCPLQYGDTSVYGIINRSDDDYENVPGTAAAFVSTNYNQITENNTVTWRAGRHY